MRTKFWESLLDISASDPDDARRGRLLSIILLGLMAAVVFLMVFLVVLHLLNPEPLDNDAYRLWGMSLGALVAFGVLYLVGRMRSGWVARLVFLLFLVGLLLVADSPQEVVGGRSTYYEVLPIIIASMLFRPSTSFHVAGLVIAAYILMAWRLGLALDVFAPLIFMLTALLSWLSAHTMERALYEARSLNRELNRRVFERTQHLQAALLREQAEASKNQAILHSIGDSVMVFDNSGKLVVANPAFSRLSGLALEEELGKPFESFLRGLSPEHQAAALELFQACDESRSTQVELGQAVFSLHMAPVMLETGQPAGVVAVLHDITHEVEVSRMKSAFVAMVSHELRTPLNAILGLVELLQYQMYGPLNEKQTDVVRRVMVNVDRLSTLVKDLLDHARIEAGTLTIEQEVFSPLELVQGVEDTLAEIARGRGLAFVTEVDPALPEQMLGDAHRLNQILTNLANNAIKFTQQGQVRVDCRRVDAARWALSVSDTGIGIAPEAHERIFEPFWQVDGSIGRKHGGTGLGLSIVRRLISLMGGEIGLESQLGTGSTFTVTLPLCPAAQVVENFTDRSSEDGQQTPGSSD